MNHRTCVFLLASAPLAFFGAPLLLAQPSAQGPSAPPADQREDAIVLSAFEVKSDKDRGYVATNSVSGTVFATPIRELPMSVSVMTSEMIEDIAAADLQEIARFLPGVNSSVDPRFPTTFVMRGFENGGGALRNGLKQSSLAEAYNIDRVEYFQGPASLLYGQNQPGGVLNMITVKPVLGENRASGALTVGSWDRIEGKIDLNAPLGKSQTAAVRVIAAESDANNWRDYVWQKKSYINGQVLWRPSSRFEARVEYDYGERKGNFASQQFQGNSAQLLKPTPTVVDASAPGGTRLLRTGDPVGSGIGAALGSGFAFPIDRHAPDYPPGGSRFNAHNEDGKADRALETLFADVKWQILSNVALNVTAVRSRSHEVTILNANNRWGDGGLWMPLQWSGSNNRTESSQMKVNLVGEFSFAGTDHQLVVGYQRDMNRSRNRNLVTNYSRIAWFLFTDPQPRLADANPRWSGITNGWNFNDGYYVADMVRALDGRLRLMGGARRSTQHARIGQNEQSKTTIQGGVSYDVVSWFTPYVSYSESFIPINGLNADGSSFVPETGAGYDIGFKMSTPDGRVSGTVAYYEIEKENIRQVDLVRTLDPANTSRQNFFNQGGLHRSEGIQVELNYMPTQDLQLQVTYAYTDAYTVADATNPALVGRTLGMISPHTASAVGRYSFNRGGLKGLTVGANIDYGSEKVSSGRSDLILLKNPAYTVVGGFARYATKVWGQDVEFGFNVRNLLDEDYYAQSSGDSGVFAADPRSYQGTVRFSF